MTGTHTFFLYFDFACPEDIFVEVRLWTHLSHLTTRWHMFALTPSHDALGFDLGTISLRAVVLNLGYAIEPWWR